MTFHLNILAAEKEFYDGEANSIIIPTTDGMMGIEANHNNMIAAIVPGVLTMFTDTGTKHIAAVSEGIIKVEKNSVTILVNTIERPSEIDINRAKKAEAEAKEALLQQQSRRSYHSAKASMARAMSRLKVKEL